MKKIIKIISAFFLWLAFLIIFAHSIIPHDHITSDTLARRENTCSGPDGKTGHHHGFPAHCHAFNEFTPEKIVKYVLAKEIQFTDFTICCPSDTYDVQVCCVAIADQKNTFPCIPYMESAPLRAPPSLG